MAEEKFIVIVFDFENDWKMAEVLRGSRVLGGKNIPEHWGLRGQVNFLVFRTSAGEMVRNTAGLN